MTFPPVKQPGVDAPGCTIRLLAFLNGRYIFTFFAPKAIFFPL